MDHQTIESDTPLPFLTHLKELRRRLIICITTVVIFSIVGYKLAPLILKEMVSSVGKLVFIAPYEAFIVNIRIAFFFGIYFSLPVILYQTWKFVERGLLPMEKRWMLLFIVISFFLFSVGMVFCYHLVIPVAVKFLLSYAHDILQPMLSANSYITFLITFLFSFGIIFDFPVVIVLLTRVRIISANVLIHYRRVVIVGIFILSAIITPPDIFTQILLALPLVFVYEISIWLAKWLEAK